MKLEQQIAEAIIKALDELGGDPREAVRKAQEVGVLDQWTNQELRMGAIAGGAELVIPALQVVTIPMGISFLLHKLAYISWGIGTIRKAYIIETDHYSDLRNILNIWASDDSIQLQKLAHFAIRNDAFVYAMSPEGYAKIEATIAKAEADEQENSFINTLYILKSLVDDYSSDEKSIEMLRVTQGEAVAETLMQMASTRPVQQEMYKNVDRPFESRTSIRLANRLAGQIALRLPAKFVMGFIPIAGPIFNAAFNLQILKAMSDTALKYYNQALSRADLEKL